MDKHKSIYQGARAQRDGTFRNDASFRPALTSRVSPVRAVLNNYGDAC
jgi:hypothetical protein